MPNQRIPKRRLHKPTGQAVVRLNDHDFYLGRFDHPKSKEQYDRVIAEWLAAGRRLPVHANPDTDVNELIVAYWRHAQRYYVKKGHQTVEVQTIGQAVRPLQRLYGSTVVAQFGPRELKVVQQEMVRLGWNRNHINKQVSRLRSMFKWAGAEGLVDPAVYHRLQVVAPLKKGRTKAREPRPIKPVPRSHIRRIRPCL